jgi:peptidoglycan/LPS O-acetylase OafA/YrhL
MAAVAVMLHHYSSRYALTTRTPLPLSVSFPQGHYGVDLFFILSGFVIMMTLTRTRDAYEFAASRVARLWPAYLACMTLTWAGLTLANERWPLPTSVNKFLFNLTMMPDVFGYGYIDGSYWSLFYELAFYALAAAAYYLGGGRRIELLCFGWLVVSVAFHVLNRQGAIGRWGSLVQLYMALKFAPLFVMGVMLYRIRSESGGRTSWAILVLAWGCCGLGAPYHTDGPIPGWGYFLLAGALASLVWAATREGSVLAKLRPVVFLGTISYPLYLIHQNLGYLAIRRLTAAGVGPHAAVLIAIALAILTAAAIHELVEKPGQNAVRALFALARRRLLGSTVPTTPSVSP